jgi:AraC family transcriptional regulator
MNDDAASARLIYDSRLSDAGGREVQALPARSDAMVVALYASPPYAVTLPPLGVARLSINLSQASVCGGLDGEPPRAHLARRHSLFLTPAGAGAAWRKASSSRHINIYFDARSFDHPEDAVWGSLLADAMPLQNAGLAGGGPMFDMLAAELSEAHPFRVEAVDSLARLILVRVARRQTRGAARANPLTPALQARLIDYVAAHLDQRVLVADLAAVTGLSANRFALACVGATGRSPHQFVLQLRLERAVQLLCHSTHSLAEIAVASGFSSQQHMTRVMRQRLGTTPARQRPLTRGSRIQEPWPSQSDSRCSQVLKTT